MATLPKDFVGGRPPVIRSAAARVISELGKATVRPSWEAYILGGFLSITITGIFGFMLVTLLHMEGIANWFSHPTREVDWKIQVIGWGIVLVWLFYLVPWCIYRLVPWKVQFDRTKDTMTVRGRLRFSRNYRLASLVGLQVCAKCFHGAYTIGGGGGPGYDGYELNAIFSEGHEPRRVRIMAHGDYKHFIKDATALAKFLGVPLIRSDQ